MIRGPPTSTLFPYTALFQAYWPAGTAALHLNAVIARAVERYRRVTGSDSLERDCGLEILVETARLWVSHGHHDHTGDRKSTRLNSSHANISYAVFCLQTK